MSRASLRFASDILRRLGEELNPNPDQGILELVKNSYDADALSCAVRLNNVASPSGSILVVDDGAGMTADDVREGWLVVGRSKKSAASRTPLGRIPAGNKGLGRLAALRLGQTVSLTTRPAVDPRKSVKLDINWADFDQGSMVEDVALEVRELRRRPGAGHGTRIVIDGLRVPLRRMDVKRLARALILLGDPFGDDPSAFRPTLEAPEYEDLASLVSTRYFDDADFHLVASTDSNGVASAEVVDWRGRVLFKADHDDLRRGNAGARFNLPPVRFDFWAFVLTRTTFAARSVSIGEVRDWLANFGGVHLYVNGLRVAPYGNPGNDWLEINVSRARSPEERPSTNNSLGRISIVDEREALRQKTDRSGLIEDESFDELRAFAKEALDWMARRRLELAEQRRRAGRAATAAETTASRQSVKKQIQTLPVDYRRDLERSFSKYDRARNEREVQLGKELQLYRTLATAGITAATFAHESAGNPLKILTQAISAIERRGKTALKGQYEVKLAGPLDSLRNATQTLTVLSDVTLGLVSSDRRRSGRVELHTVIERTVATFRPFTQGRDVVVEVDLAPGRPYLRGSEAAIESIVANMLNNALVAFEQAETRERRIGISTEIVARTARMVFKDNGPGIDGIAVADIWLPGESARAGTGLGLTIVRDAVADLGGTVGALAHGAWGGAEFDVELPILGA